MGKALWLGMCGILAGLGLRASLSPVCIPAAAPAALGGILYLLRRRSWLAWGWAGTFAGLVWCGMLPWGLLGWGPVLTVFPWLVCGIAVGGIFAVAGYLNEKSRFVLGAYAFPISWAALAISFEVINLPIAITAGWVSHPKWVAGVRLVGVQGMDAVVALIAGSVAELVSSRPRRKIVDAGLCVMSVGFAWTAQFFGRPEHSEGPRLYAVQPAIPTEAFRKAQWSLFHRDEIETRLDALTWEAGRRGPGIVVIPEGGNGLPNVRLERRRAVIEALAQGSRAEILMGSMDRTPEGHHYNVVHHVTKDGIVDSARKANVVPFAERGLTRGAPKVIATAWAPIGISICFDSVFGLHVRQLERLGAEMLVVVSDNASFGESYLSDLHLSYSLLRAVEVGRPMLFVSNGGPVAAYTGTGDVIHFAEYDGRATVHEIDMPKSSDRTWASRGGRCLVPALGLGLLLWGGRRRGRTLQLPRLGRERLLAYCKSAVVAGCVGVPLIGIASFPECLVSIWGKSVGIESVIEEARSRYAAPSVLDAISPLFKQRDEVACGPTSLAYALTLLGDRVFGNELTGQAPADVERGYSFAELARLAEQRGFSANGFRGTIADLRREEGWPTIAHLAIGHFIVVLRVDKDDVVFFDPATGRTHRSSIKEFGKLWSGRFLRLRTREGPMGPRRESGSLGEEGWNEGPLDVSPGASFH